MEQRQWIHKWSDLDDAEEEEIPLTMIIDIRIYMFVFSIDKV